jgi:hypothetical protein
LKPDIEVGETLLWVIGELDDLMLEQAAKYSPINYPYRLEIER